MRRLRAALKTYRNAVASECGRAGSELVSLPPLLPLAFPPLLLLLLPLLFDLLELIPLVLVLVADDGGGGRLCSVRRKALWRYTRSPRVRSVSASIFGKDAPVLSFSFCVGVPALLLLLLLAPELCRRKFLSRPWALLLVVPAEELEVGAAGAIVVLLLTSPPLLLLLLLLTPLLMVAMATSLSLEGLGLNLSEAKSRLNI